MDTIYKSIKLSQDNKLVINKKEVMELDITNDIFKYSVITRLKEMLTKYPSDKKRVNYILENDFIIESNSNQTSIISDKVTIYISSYKDNINVIIQ